MLPTLISLGDFHLSTFGVMLAVTFVIFSFQIWRTCRDAGLEDEKIFDNIIIVTLLALFGARLSFVISHWTMFAPSILRVFILWKYAGLEFWGGIIIGVIALFFYTKKQKISSSFIFDAYARVLPLSMFIVSLGIFLDGSVAGRQTSWITGVVEIGRTGKRHPIGVYAMVIAGIAIFGAYFLNRLVSKKKIPNGAFALIVFSFIGFSQLLLAFFRDDLLYWQGFSVDHILATIMMIAPLVPLYTILNGRQYVKSWKQFSLSSLKNRNKKENA